MTETKLKEKFLPLVGCPVFIDQSDGFLVIDSKAKVLKIGNYGKFIMGMFSGIIPLKSRVKGYPLAVTYNGFNIACYQNKYTRII